MTGRTQAHGELAWLRSVLWDNAAHTPSGGRYAVLPSMARPRLLVPLGSRQAAARALAGYTTSRRLSRIGARGLAAGFRVGLAPHLVRGRAGPPPEDSSDALFERHIERIAGRPVLMSIFFQTGRPQKKPVMQLLTPDGRVLGYAKVGWNELTRRLVRAEGEALELVARRLAAGAPFGVAGVRHRGAWRGRELLVVDAVADVAPALMTDLPDAATAALAGLGERRRGQLRSSGYWREQQVRMSAAADPVLPGLARIAEQSSGDELDFGFGHGDWVPWNMGRRPDGRLLVWDWEWWRAELPAGLDAAQWLLQVELNLHRRDPGAAVDTALARARGALPRLGVDPGAARALLAMHLIEAILRLQEGRSSGVGSVIAPTRYAASAARLEALAA